MQTYYQKTGGALNQQAISNIQALLEGKACYEGEEREVFRRLAAHEGCIYIDLGTTDWSAVEVTQEGWRIVQDVPVSFIRSASQLPLPIPEPGGNLLEFFDLVNLDHGDRPLIAGWLVGALSPEGPYPVLALCGEQGSGKSNLARMIRGLVDPCSTPLRAAPRQTRDLMVAALHNRVLAFDNMSRITEELSDALCQVATGGGFGSRALYSDAEEATINVKRPVILTSIEHVIARGDLIDRAILINLPTIPETGRQTEQQLLHRYNEARGRIFGALLNGAVSGLRRHQEIAHHLRGHLPRMADFTIWATAAEAGLGIEMGSFLRAFNEPLVRMVWPG